MVVLVRNVWCLFVVDIWYFLIIDLFVVYLFCYGFMDIVFYFIVLV